MAWIRTPRWGTAPLALASVSGLLFAVRLLAANAVGFGDSEALYASYALHPQPAYLDHPGLVGVVALAMGDGTAPSAFRAHLLTSVLATAFPWLIALACRASGATWQRAAGAALVIALTPEIAIGLFALTPDLLLSFAWVSAIILAASALRSRPGSLHATAMFAAAGLAAGVGASAKVSGLALWVALAAAFASRPARPHARTVAPWAGLCAGLLVLVPVVLFEARAGYPMLRHRLVDTQGAAGISLRNAGALLFGQLLYLSPLVAWLALRTARTAWRDRGDAVGSLLLMSVVVPLPPLVALCLWSPVAEPHWLAPALLGLLPAAARAEPPTPRSLLVMTWATSAAVVSVVFAWVLIPGLSRVAPASADPRLDLTNELFGWPKAIAAVRQEASAAWSPGAQRGDVTVAGPHWVICAQLDAALRGEWPVGCNTPVRDDFDDWWPRHAWRDAEVIVWVSDMRFDADPAAPSYSSLLSSYAPTRIRHVPVVRDRRTVRRFTITVLSRRAAASLRLPAAPPFAEAEFNPEP